MLFEEIHNIYKELIYTKYFTKEFKILKYVFLQIHNISIKNYELFV